MLNEVKSIMLQIYANNKIIFNFISLFNKYFQFFYSHFWNIPLKGRIFSFIFNLKVEIKIYQSKN